MYDYKPFTYWNELPRNNPPKYYSLKSLKQMQKDCTELDLSAFLTTTEDHSNGNESKRRKLVGETLQTWSRDEILRVFPELVPDDVISVKMEATGEDLALSEKALKLLNFLSFEMKNQKKGNKMLYHFMDQAKRQAKPNQNPIVVLFYHSFPNAEPLLCMSFEAWLMATRRFAEERGEIH